MGLKKYTGEVIKEGKRVRWPKRNELFTLIVTVLAVVTFAAVVLLVEDLAAASMLGAIEDALNAIRG